MYLSIYLSIHKIYLIRRLFFTTWSFKPSASPHFSNMTDTFASTVEYKAEKEEVLERERTATSTINFMKDTKSRPLPPPAPKEYAPALRCDVNKVRNAAFASFLEM